MVPDQPLCGALLTPRGEQVLDEGDPLQHGAYALIEPVTSQGLSKTRNDPDAVVEQLANLIALVSSYALAFSRQIWSADGFRSVGETLWLHEACGEQEFLQAPDVCFTDERLAQLRRAWDTAATLWQAGTFRSRIMTALGHFYQAWRSDGIEHNCLHLATLVDVLFAPPQQGDTAYLSSLTVARFAGRDRAEREALYPLLRRFYGCRAAILQGGNGQDDGFIDTRVTMFHQVAALLERILTEEDLARIFNSPSERYQRLMACLLN